MVLIVSPVNSTDVWRDENADSKIVQDWVFIIWENFSYSKDFIYNYGENLKFKTDGH